MLVPPLKYLVRGYLQSEKATGLTATAQVCRPNRLDPIGSTAIADGDTSSYRQSYISAQIGDITLRYTPCVY